jgi:hypothetical protein
MSSNTSILKTILVVILLIGTGGLGYYVGTYNPHSDKKKKNVACTPTATEKVTGAKPNSYKYNSKNKCAPTECVDGYTFDSSSTSCAKLPATHTERAGQPCRPSYKEKVPHGDFYVWGRDGVECLVSQCQTGYDADLGSGKCNKNL